MDPTRVDRAVLNNICWYQAIFDAHGLRHSIDDKVWCSHALPPAFHSNLVVLAPTLTERELDAYVNELRAQPHLDSWSLKDSYACLDLAPRGFTQLFQAAWIWRDPELPARGTVTPRLTWSRVTQRAELAAWEDAWWGNPRNKAAAARIPHIPAQLLTSPDHAFFAGKTDGVIVAGGIANRSPGAIGLSNLFAPPGDAQEAWIAVVGQIAALFPNTPIVGYEQGADLDLAVQAGFQPIGPLRVWQNRR